MSDPRIIRPRLHHWGMRTVKFQEMLDWYTTVIGFEVVLSSEVPIRSAFVTNDTEHHRGGFFNTPMFKEHHERHQAPGVNHLAFEYDGIDDLLSSWERLKNVGIEPVLCTDHGPTFAFYYKDPERNTVELLCDAYEDPDKPSAYMHDPKFVANPMGTQVDPSNVLAARRAGLSLAELHERAMAGEYLPATVADPRILA